MQYSSILIYSGLTMGNGPTWWKSCFQRSYETWKGLTFGTKMFPTCASVHSYSLVHMWFQPVIMIDVMKMHSLWWSVYEHSVYRYADVPTDPDRRINSHEFGLRLYYNLCHFYLGVFQIFCRKIFCAVQSAFLPLSENGKFIKMLKLLTNKIIKLIITQRKDSHWWLPFIYWFRWDLHVEFAVFKLVLTVQLKFTVFKSSVGWNITQSCCLSMPCFSSVSTLNDFWSYARSRLEVCLAGWLTDCDGNSWAKSPTSVTTGHNDWHVSVSIVHTMYWHIGLSVSFAICDQDLVAMHPTHGYMEQANCIIWSFLPDLLCFSH